MTDPFAAPAPRSSAQADNEALSFLGGTSLPAVKWPAVGFTVEGTVEDFEMRDQTDMDTGELMFWVGKKPTKESEVKGDTSRLKVVRQLVLTLQCVPTFKTWETIHYTEVPLPDDDGLRAMYVKGAIQVAVSRAIADARGILERGAYLKVTRTANRKSASGFTAYSYTAVWTPAKGNAVAANDFLSTPSPLYTPPAAIVPAQAPNPFTPGGQFG